MKKIALLLVLLMVISVPAFAGRMVVNRLIPATSATCAYLHTDPVGASGSVRTISAENIGCFVTYDESETGGISLNITALQSWDNTNWATCSFYDYAGGSTLQTMEQLTADGTYYFWLEPNAVAPWTKVVVDAIGSDADDTAEVKAYLISREE